MANDIGGVWRTIGGRRVFIKDGQDLASAMRESGKFKNDKKKDDKPIEKKLAEQHRYTESEAVKDIKDKYMPERTKAVSDYQNGAIDREELLKRFDGNEQRMKETFEQMGYTAPTKENIDKANTRHEEFMKNLKDKDSKSKMTTPLSKEDDNAKLPYEKGEKYRNSITETAKNSKEDNVTLDTETGKVATFDKGYSVSFQQSSDNYDDKEYYEKVEECRNKCDGKLYAGKYGGDAEASFHTDDIETAKELMYKYNQESIYDWEHETLIMNDKYDASSNKTNYEAEKTTNDIMNKAIRSKADKDDLPKHVEIKSQGTSNRKEVSENIQAHILEHYDKPEDFIEQMDAYDWKPTMWHRGEALAEDGFYEIYYDDQRKFLDDLKINPKGKNFSDDRVFQTYKSLIGRESAKLYDRLKKNSYKKYLKAHPLSKMTFAEFKDMKKGDD